MSNLKIETEQSLGDIKAAAFNAFITRALIDVQSQGLEQFDMSRVSTHLACLSRLVGMLQAIDPAATERLLRAMVDIARAQRLNPQGAMAVKAQSDYVQACTDLITAWELYFAQAGNGVPA